MCILSDTASANKPQNSTKYVKIHSIINLKLELGSEELSGLFASELLGPIPLEEGLSESSESSLSSFLGLSESPFLDISDSAESSF